MSKRDLLYPGQAAFVYQLSWLPWSPEVSYLPPLGRKSITGENGDRERTKEIKKEREKERRIYETDNKRKERFC
jgi:hypothetical protein